MDENKLLRATAIVSNLIGLLIILDGNIKNPENVALFRALDVLQNIFLLNIVLFLFLPNKQTFKIALIIGIFSMIFDFILETFAVLLDWWYPLGGIQLPPVLIIPLEMVVGFIFLGTCMGIVLTFPDKMREIDFKLLNWLKPLFKEPKYDHIWRVLLIFVNAIIKCFSTFNFLSTGFYPHRLITHFFTILVNRDRKRLNPIIVCLAIVANIPIMIG